MFSTDRIECLVGLYLGARGIASSALGRPAVGKSSIMNRIHSGHTAMRTIDGV
ncbi:MAG: hypothetical protein J4F40_13550 [Alphaproteobacteria bacterium]|nr:hypothetical protein [Alphaproteobacteria bacterium]MCY4499696.1 hypothetical protein [Rhodospirillaceae bacterium]